LHLQLIEPLKPVPFPQAPLSAVRGSYHPRLMFFSPIKQHWLMRWPYFWHPL
jgi:hypothetical protein